MHQPQHLAHFKVTPLSRRSNRGAPALILLLSLLLFAACGQQTEPTSADANPTATSVMPVIGSGKVVAGPQLAWKMVTAFPLSGAPTIDPADGDVAYGCTALGQNGTAAHTFTTQDAGATWVRGGDLPVGANPAPPSSIDKGMALTCILLADTSNAATMVAETGWSRLGGNVDPSQFTSYASSDFGAHWQRLPASGAIISQLASWQGHIYALRQGDDPAIAGTLWVSSDHMASWQPAGSQSVGAFWLNPNDGALLAQSAGAGTSSDLFYTSTDGGKTWTQLAVPALDSSGDEWLVAAPLSDQPWQICGTKLPSSSGQTNALSCTTDGGQTWRPRPVPTQEQPGSHQLYTVSASFLALTPDGAVLAVTVMTPPDHVYRLQADSGNWQDLGPDPQATNGTIVYAPTSSGGIFWDTTQQEVQTATYPLG